MGITDVDDKIIKKAVALQHENWSQALRMVRGLENDFFRDMDKLNVLRPDHVLRVTEHMSNIIAYTEQLVRNGNAYVTTDGVYFDFSSLVNVYDKFGCSDIPADEPEEGRGILAAEGGVSTTYATSAVKHRKRNARDFALWKLQDASAPFTWDSPWGPGRPGWHIECSAMTHSLFGTRLDIHSGGVDLKFPHHTNEIAQW